MLRWAYKVLARYPLFTDIAIILAPLIAIVAVYLLSACTYGPVFRPCPHGGGVYLSAHSEEPLDPPQVPRPFGEMPPGMRASTYPPVIVRVTVHNTKDFPIEVQLHCGVNDALNAPHVVSLGPLQETDLVFPVQRRADGLSVKFSCEIENWVSK